MRGKADWYNRHVNQKWGDDVHPMTEQEAISATRKLWRVEIGKPCPYKFKFTTGNRRTRRLHGFYVINCSHGWRELVHSLSHRIHAKLYPGNRPHAGVHAAVEKRLTDAVIGNDWHHGALKREPKVRAIKPKPDPSVVRYERVLASIKRWETKAKRAATALKKLHRQKSYYQRNGINARPLTDPIAL